MVDSGVGLPNHNPSLVQVLGLKKDLKGILSLLALDCNVSVEGWGYWVEGRCG